ncbi:MAG: class A beta-lactamase-related serine hydrolase, partial [Rickettsiales bacterium]|nr:class A beta-lactamase-related serine hydrolase [Rickettsiales bacterium]
MKFPVFNKQISWYAIRLDKLNTISQKDAHSKLYPASSFKVFIAASLLQDDTINLETIIKLPESNPSTDLFPINLKTLHAGKTGTISEFIFSMLQDSDNRASNALADLTDTEKLSRDQRYDDTGITQIFKDNKKCMYSQRLETSAYDLAMFAANLENSNNEY